MVSSFALGKRNKTMDPTEARMPKLICFDLDFTVWNLCIYTYLTPPIARRGNTINAIYDREGLELALYEDVPEILAELRNSNIHIAAASRTAVPNLAKEALDLLLVPVQKGSTELAKVITYFDTIEIYPGSKLHHFKSIQAKTGISYSEMLFFDDEPRNKEVEQLGIIMQLVCGGLDTRTYNQGLAKWRERNGHCPSST